MFGMMLYKRKMDADFSEKLKALETEVSTDIQRILAEISILSDPRRTEELVLRMSLLIESKRRAISKLEGPANAFFNTSALDKTPTDYWRVASSTQSIAKGYREWAESYAAALSIALFDKYITIVQERQQVAQTHVAILRTAQRLAEQQASMEAGRLAAQQAEHERARLAEEQAEHERSRLAEEHAEHERGRLAEEQAEHERSRLAEEQAEHERSRLAEEQVEHERARLAEEQVEHERARLAEEQVEHERARLAEGQAEHERARLAEEQAEHTKEALSELTQPTTSEAKPAAELAEAQRQMASAAVYVAHASDAGRIWSVIAGPHNPTQQLPGNWEKANDVAKRFFVRRLSTILGRRVSILAALYPSDMSSGELTPQMFAVDASALGVSPNTDIGFIASKRGTVDVTHRLMPDIEAQDARLEWVKTDGVHVASRVRVRPVVYDPATNAYTFTRDGETTPVLIWTPQAPLTDSSTRLPSVQQAASIYGGAGTAVIPEDSVHPEHVAEPDDYILDLPAELGLGKPYIYFRNPRRIPGVASGYGQPVVGTWLGESATGQGAAIPSQIADRLRGRRFSSFDKLRETVWQEVASDPVLSHQFTKWDVDLMKEGGHPTPQRKNDEAGEKNSRYIMYMRWHGADRFTTFQTWL
jgi:hypothetical protein